MCDARRSPSYHRFSPSKQHLLCDGKSGAEVILAHGDFRRGGNGRLRRRMMKQKGKKADPTSPTPRDVFRKQAPSTVPEVRFVLPPVPLRLVLVLDVSQRMRVGDRWRRCREALFVLLSHLPVGSELAIVTFDGSDNPRVTTPLTIVREGNREGLFGRIPYRLSSDREGCAACGLRSALDLLKGAGGGGVLLALSGSKLQQEDKSGRNVRMEQVQERLDANPTPVYHVFFGEEDALSSAVTRYGKSFSVSATRMQKDTLLQRLSDVFRSVLGSIGGPRIVNTYQRYVSWNGHQSRGTFRVDDELLRAGGDLWIVLTSAQKEDVESFEVTSPSGRRMAFPKYDHGIVFFKLRAVSQDVEPGIWSYEARLHHTVSNGALVSVQVFGEEARSKSAAGGGIQVKVWTSDGDKLPVKIYALITQDRLPVQNARVVALLTKPGGGYEERQLEITLKDGGSGYPDITAKDGVYSAYVTDYAAEPGFYGLAVRVTDNDGSAVVSKPYGGAMKRGERCCGSALPEYFTVPTQPFERHVTAASFAVETGVQHVVKEGSPEMRDIFPPSRVTDLAIAGYGHDLDLTLTWTAPGGDFNVGAAVKYELRCYTKREAVDSSERFASMAIPAVVSKGELPTPLRTGEVQKVTVVLPAPNTNYFYALVAVDLAGNRSPVSNLVRAFVEVVSTTARVDLTYGVSANGSATRLLNGKLLVADDSPPAAGIEHETVVYLVAGGITAFVFILSVLFFAAVCRARRRNRDKQQGADSPPPPPYHPSIVGDSLVMRGNVIVGNGGPNSATVVTLPDLTPAEKLSHMWGKSGESATHSSSGGWPYPSLVQHNNGPISLQPHANLSPQQQHHHQQPLSLAGLFPSSPGRHQHGVGLPLQDISSSSDMPTSGSSNASPTCLTSWAAVSANGGAAINVKGGSSSAATTESSGSVVGGGGKPTKSKCKGSDSGTTASTDCSTDSDHNSDDKNVYNVPSSTVRKDRRAERELSSVSSVSKLDMTPSMIALERKKRQESLV